MTADKQESGLEEVRVHGSLSRPPKPKRTEPSATAWNRMVDFPAPEGSDLEWTEDNSRWRFKPQKVVTLHTPPADPEADRRHFEAKMEKQADDYLWEAVKAAYLAGQGEPTPDQVRPTEATPSPSDARTDLQEKLDAALSRAEAAEARLNQGLERVSEEREPELEGMPAEFGQSTNLDEEDEIVATINVRGVDYNITGRDTMLFTAALVRGLNQETSTIKLASGEQLELTLADIEDIAAQLVGPMS